MSENLLRLDEVLRRIPIGRSTWYKKVKQGILPKPVKLGPRTAAWRESDIIRIIENGIE